MSPIPATLFAASTKRRQAAFLGVLVLHLGALHWINAALKQHKEGNRAARQDIEVTIAVIPPRPQRPTPPSKPHPAVANNANNVRQGAMAQHAAEQTRQEAQTGTPSTAGQPMAAEPAPLNLDKLGQSAAAQVIEDMKGKTWPDGTPEPRNKIADTIAQTARTKCDNNYKPKLAGVQMDGLMKLPFLLGSAVTDKGCKW